VFGSSLPLGQGQTKKINGFLCMIPDTHKIKYNITDNEMLMDFNQNLLSMVKSIKKIP
jgi:hypothetical protein